MKNHINVSVQSALKISEEYLFSEMANCFNQNAPTVFVKKVHGGKAEFWSTLRNANRQREIADLLLICRNRKGQVRISFLQAKYHKGRIAPFLTFGGDYLQLELLSTRPKLLSNSYGFDQDILSHSQFSQYRSLTTFGVFYYDRLGDIDFLYAIVDLLSRASAVGKSDRGKIHFPGRCNCPRSNCFTGYGDEMYTTCALDIFERAVLGWQIGAPLILGDTISLSVARLLVKARAKNANNADSIDKFIRSLGGVTETSGDDKSGGEDTGYPNIMLIDLGEVSNSSPRW